MQLDPYAAANDSAQRLRDRTGVAAFDVAVVLGSGWSAAADLLRPVEAEIPLTELGGFATPAVPGHSGTARHVSLGNKRVLLYTGRVHGYEGHSPDTIVHPIRTAIAAGCSTVILTNAAGGIRAGLRPGEPVLVRDHLNLTGKSPLYGPPPPEGYPSRFTDLSALYTPRLRELARATDPSLTEGVYACLPGPHYETPAEIAMLAAMGADLVGMSTVLEAIAARHLGADVIAVSLVTNLAAGISAQALSHTEVTDTAKAAGGRVGALLAALIPLI